MATTNQHANRQAFASKYAHSKSKAENQIKRESKRFAKKAK